MLCLVMVVTRTLHTMSSSSSRILVSAELHGCGVYLAGERLACTITFSNQGTSAETIAWAGAQIHCQACVREDIVRLDEAPPSSHSHTSAETAFIPNRGSQTLIEHVGN